MSIDDSRDAQGDNMSEATPVGHDTSAMMNMNTTQKVPGSHLLCPAALGFTTMPFSL
jgi:hypothetical protein